MLFLTSRDYVAGGACPSKATIHGKTVIVTGANTGIGKQTALELAKRGDVLVGTRLLCPRLGGARSGRGGFGFLGNVKLLWVIWLQVAETKLTPA